MSSISCFFLILICMAGFQCPAGAAEQKTHIKAIIFDFGGVIAKTDKQEVAEFIAQSLDISQEEALQALIGLKENSLNDGIEIDYWQAYAKSKGKKLPNRWLEELDQIRINALKEIPGMVDLVRKIKDLGYQTALLSNVRKSQAQIKRKLGFYDLFHPAILSYEVGIRKPDLKAYYMILGKLNMAPQEVIFVDNKPSNIEAAKSLGIDAILFQNADRFICDLKERGIDLLAPTKQ